ncbi:MAG: GntR family transcriptional regulator [Alphaproteobacteria bacterium]|nr:GntR family transcriptional regulator [Alphaproteobacteria bacterium]
MRQLLTRRLLAGVYSPGDKLSLRRVAADLGVSMTPVREAVSRLVADGALEVAPSRAVRVPILGVGEFRELTALRIEIEGLAAAWAAERRDDADLAVIAEAEAGFRLERARPAPDLVLTVAINQKLHFAIYRAARSPMLMEIITGLWLKAGPILNLDMSTNVARVSSGTGERYHTAALAAVRARDAVGARDAVAGDIAQACKYIISLGRLPANRSPQYIDGGLLIST